MHRCLTVLLAGVALPTAVFADTLSLRADHWMPFNGDPASDRPGIMIEVVRAIFPAEGITVDYQISPWARSVKDCEEGRIDGIIGATHEDFPDGVFPAEALGTVEVALIVPAASTFTYHDIASIQAVRLGCIAEYTYTDELDAHIAANPGGRVNVLAGDAPLAQAIALLQRGRLDVFVEDPKVFHEALAEAHADAAAFRTAATLASKPLYIAFSPARPNARRYAALLDAGVARLRASGELQALLAKYGMQEGH